MSYIRKMIITMYICFDEMIWIISSRSGQLLECNDSRWLQWSGYPCLPLHGHVANRNMSCRNFLNIPSRIDLTQPVSWPLREYVHVPPHLNGKGDLEVEGVLQWLLLWTVQSNYKFDMINNWLLNWQLLFWCFRPAICSELLAVMRRRRHLVPRAAIRPHTPPRFEVDARRHIFWCFSIK